MRRAEVLQLAASGLGIIRQLGPNSLKYLSRRSRRLPEPDSQLNHATSSLHASPIIRNIIQCALPSTPSSSLINYYYLSTRYEYIKASLASILVDQILVDHSSLTVLTSYIIERHYCVDAWFGSEVR